MGRIIGVFLLLTVVAPTIAAADDKPAARAAYINGTRLYDLNRFKEALDEFEKAYLNYEDSAFLFNIAQCQRQLNNKPEALKFYRTYLRKVPNAPNAEQVRQVMADLEKGIKEDQLQASKPPVGTTPSGLGATPAVETGPVPAPAAALPATEPSVSVTATAFERKPAYKKWWVWTLVGVGVAAVAVGVGVGVTPARKPKTSPPRCTSHEKAQRHCIALARWVRHQDRRSV